MTRTSRTSHPAPALCLLTLLVGCIAWMPAAAAPVTAADLDRQIKAAERADGLDEMIGLLEPFERKPEAVRFPARLSQLRVMLGTAYELKETRESDLAAIGVYARTLEMPDAPEENVKGVADSLRRLTGKWCNASLDLLADRPGEAIAILRSVERDGRRALEQPLLGDVRYVLAMAYQADGQKLRAADMFMQHADMVEADQESRAHSLEEVAGLLAFDNALSLAKGMTADEAAGVLEGLLERLSGRPAQRATAFFALARVRVRQKSYREAVRSLRSARQQLPASETAKLLKLARAEEEILDDHFGRLQVRCPPGMKKGDARVTIYGPLGREDEGIRPEHSDKPCSASGLYFIKGTYLVTSYGLLDSRVPSRRYQVVLDPDRQNERRKLITLEARKPPIKTYHGALTGVGLGALAGGLALQLLVDDDGSNAELGDTASVVLLSTAAVLFVWALVEYGRAEDLQDPPYFMARQRQRLRPTATAGPSITPTGLLWRF